jgi:hypothetical protein
LNRIVDVVDIAEEPATDLPDHRPVKSQKCLEGRRFTIMNKPLQELSVRQPGEGSFVEHAHHLLQSGIRASIHHWARFPSGSTGPNVIYAANPMSNPDFRFFSWSRPSVALATSCELVPRSLDLCHRRFDDFGLSFGMSPTDKANHSNDLGLSTRSLRQAAQPQAMLWPARPRGK